MLERKRNLDTEPLGTYFNDINLPGANMFTWGLTHKSGAAWAALDDLTKCFISPPVPEPRVPVSELYRGKRG